MAQNNPYIGPRTFQRNEGHLFFGREREARDLIALVASERLVVFYAQSGAGKSSIVNTRLIPNLETKEYEVLPVGRMSGDLTAGDGADNIYIHNLIRSLEQHDTDDPKTFASLTLSDFLAHLNYDDKGFFYDPTPVEVDPAADSTEVARRILIIDQFEELFSMYPESWEKRENFFEQMAKAMEDDPQLWVVLVMREDYIAALDPYAHIVSNGLRVRYYMQRLGREAALKAVKSPVEGIRPYAEGIAEKLIDDLCSIKVQKPDGTFGVQPGQYVEPVQLQVVCYGLWGNLPDGGTQISAQDLQDVGDVNQSLGKYYDKRVGEVAKAKNVRERLIRDWFEKKLITTGGIRNMVLQEREPKPGELHDDVIQALQSDLVRGEKRGGATWYELTHDRLVEPVLERNKIWFAENLSPLQRQAALWKDQDQNENWLLTGDALNEVVTWAKEHQDELGKTEQDYLEQANKLAQVAQAQAKAERRGRLVTGGFLIAAFILIFVLSKDPIRREMLRQQALKSEMVTIPAGDYILGKHLEPEDNPSDFLAYDTYHIASFSINPYPVTNSRYVFCINAGICSRPDALQSEYTDPARGDKLVVNITAIDAAGFCKWLGMRLPSEKEWELAVHKNAFKAINPNALVDAVYFFEWTNSSYDAEWTDISKDPPKSLINKGGDLSKTFEENMYRRQGQRSTQADFQTGFRCAIDQ